MGPEPAFDFATIVKALDERGVRFVLFGRQAMRALGAPVFTQDYDVWFDAAAREEVLAYFADELGYELSHASIPRPPVVKVLAGADRIDAWFVRGMSNRDQTRIDYEDVWKRSLELEDPVSGLRLRVPSLDDMIALKKMAPVPRPKDEEDIRYLQVMKELAKRDERDEAGP